MNLICDMDGVLTKHSLSDFQGDNPAYLNRGYFLTVQPDDRMVNVVSVLANKYNRNPDSKSHVFIKTTSAFDTGIDMLQQYRDKKKWIEQYFYGINPDTDFLMIPKQRNTDSPSIVISDLCFPTEHRDITRILTNNDILIDDYNRNLEDWTKHGGLAIKYNNGINSPNDKEPDVTFNGIHITQNMASPDIIELLSIFDLA